MAYLGFAFYIRKFFIFFDTSWCGINQFKCALFVAFFFGQIPTCITLFGLSIIYLGSISGPLALFHPDLPLYQTYLLSILLMLASLISLIIATYSQEKYYSKIEAIDTNAIRSIYTPGTIYKKSNSS